MTPFVFDTLSASKQLREAGMPEGVAEAVVSVFQHAATMPDISHLATKEELKAEIETLRKEMRTGFDAIRTEVATKEDLAKVRLEIASSRAAVTDMIRQQGWLLLGGIGVLLTIVNGLVKVLG